MSIKSKTIQLAYGYRLPDDKPSDPLGYRVERVTDSLEFHPGQLISKREAEELCAHNHWKVTVIPVINR